MAMEAASNTHTCYYRPGFDMSVPLYPRESYLKLESIPPGEREFFLTVKVCMCPGDVPAGDLVVKSLQLRVISFASVAVVMSLFNIPYKTHGLDNTPHPAGINSEPSFSKARGAGTQGENIMVASERSRRDLSIGATLGGYTLTLPAADKIGFEIRPRGWRVLPGLLYTVPYVSVSPAFW